MKRETLQSIFSAILHTLAKIEFRGLENIPLEGGLLITTNHMSWMDTLHLFITPNRKDITALVADKYQSNWFFKWVLDTGGVVWLDRDKADFGALRAAVEVIKTGVAMGIAPEGTRSLNAQLQEGKPGVALLAQKTGVTIVPVGIIGTEMYFKNLKRLRRSHVILTFGPAYHLPPIDRNNRDESLKQLTDEVMSRIAVLLPPSYRGFYKDHPRVKELLAEKEKVPVA